MPTEVRIVQPSGVGTGANNLEGMINLTLAQLEREYKGYELISITNTEDLSSAQILFKHNGWRSRKEE